MVTEQKQPNKIHLFISYSRRDFGKIEKLYEALSGDDELDVYLDQHDIAAAEDWKQRLDGLVRSSDTILFAVSRDSVASDICQWEIDLATQLNKRIIPVIINDVADEDVPEEIARLNYVFARTDKELIPALQSIGDALKIDIDWIREHTRLADMAHRWEQASKLGAQPLRGKELEAAEKWLSNQPKDAPAPTELQRKYIYESRKSATKRQRMTVMGSIAAILIVGVMAGFTFVQRNAAIEGERKAEEALRTATEAANTMVFDLAEGFKYSSVPKKTIEGILEKAIKLQESLGENFEQESKLQYSKAYALLSLGSVYRTSKSFDKASVFYKKALIIFSKFADLDTANSAWQTGMASSLTKLGEINSLSGNLEGAFENYKKALAIRKRIAALDETNMRWQIAVSVNLNGLGDVKLEMGKAEEAIVFFNESLMAVRKPEIDSVNDVWLLRTSAKTLLRIGDAKKQTGDLVGALVSYEEGLLILNILVARDETDTLSLRDVVVAMNRFADLKADMAKPTEAIEAYRKGLTIVRKLVSLDEANTVWQADLAYSLSKLGGMEQQIGNNDDALVFYQEALLVERKLVALDGTNTNSWVNLAATLSYIGDIKKYLEDTVGVFEARQENLAIMRKLVSLDGANKSWKYKLSISLNNIAHHKLQIEDSVSAHELQQESLAISRELFDLDAGNPQWKRVYSNSLGGLGDVKLQLRDTKEAIELFQSALRMKRALSAQDESNTIWQRDVLVVLDQIGDARAQTNDLLGALESHKEALAIARKLIALDETKVLWWKDISKSMNAILKLYSHLKDYENGYKLGEEFLQQTAALVERFPRNMIFADLQKDAQEGLAFHAGNRAYNALFEGDYKRSEDLSREAISLAPEPLWIKINLTHALMFQDKIGEARALYQKHRGADAGDEKVWEQVILKDFKNLREKGLTHPLMNEIEALFRK